jgi:hypothetical protein
MTNPLALRQSARKLTLVFALSRLDSRKFVHFERPSLARYAHRAGWRHKSRRAQARRIHDAEFHKVSTVPAGPLKR